MRLAALLLCFSPAFAFALVNGGASTQAEYDQIQKLAPKMKAQCPLGDVINQRRSELPKVTANLLNNETSCKPGFMMEWDDKAGENFPSIGLPHVVWFPQNAKKVVDESFPRFWNYITKNYHGITRVPQMNVSGAAPWNSKAQFDSDPVVKDINRFLLDPDVLKLEGEFAVQRGLDSVYTVMAANSLDPQAKMSQKDLCTNFKNLIASPQGLMAVVDYVNWKGEGVHYSEKTDRQNVRWGLKQVLEKIGPVAAGDKKAHLKFAEAAEAVLKDRAADDARITKSMRGLLNRIDSTYRKGGIEAGHCALTARATATGVSQQAGR